MKTEFTVGFMGEVLETLETTPRGKARTEYLAKVLDEVPSFIEVLQYAMDPLITFGVQAFPELPPAPEPSLGDMAFSVLRSQLLEPLRQRQLTGHAADERIVEVLGPLGEQERKWVERIITQKLRLGIGPKTVNKIIPDAIFQFPVPLAESFDKVKPAELEGLWVVQPKADGARVVAELPVNGPVRMFSRTGHLWENFDVIADELERINAARERTETLYIDGEVVSFLDGKVDFQAIQKTMLSTESKVVVGTLAFLVFDFATKDEWENSKKPWGERYAEGRDFLSRYASPELIRPIGVHDVVQTPTPEYLERESVRLLEMGWEGLMLRRPDAPVKLTRNKTLLKVKLFDDSEATILDVEEGQGDRAGMTGRLVLKDNKDGEIFRAGSGLTKKLAQEIWDNKEKYIGQQVTYQYFGKTDANKPRHPTIKYFRHEEDV